VNLYNARGQRDELRRVQNFFNTTMRQSLAFSHRPEAQSHAPRVHDHINDKEYDGHHGIAHQSPRFEDTPSKFRDAKAGMRDVAASNFSSFEVLDLWHGSDVSFEELRSRPSIKLDCANSGGQVAHVEIRLSHDPPPHRRRIYIRVGSLS
jgi:hypothetical protein